MTDAHRESCRRQHRVLGHFLAVQAWLRGLECVVLVRGDLEVFLNLERFKSTRVSWLREDLNPWFPKQFVYNSSASPSSLHSLFLSRVPIEPFLPLGTMTTEKRIAGVKPGGPKTERLSQDSANSKPPSERDIVRYLAVLDSGLDQPIVLKAVKAGA